MDCALHCSIIPPEGGFNFENVKRNQLLASILPSARHFPAARKTGTTICGVKCADCVVLGADTRATEDTIIADKNCEKLHKMADNMYCAGAGTSADLEHTTGLMASKLELHRLATGRQPRLSTAISLLSHTLFKYQGHVSCALVLGGYDFHGPQLYKVFPHGSTDKTPFAAMGSGSLCAEGRLELGYKDGLTVEEGKTLVASAIRAGIMNDLGSGGNIDLVVIDKNGCTYLRGHEESVAGMKRQPREITFPSGTTAILRQKVQELKKVVDVVEDVQMGV